MSVEERPADWHGRRPDAHRYRCRACGHALSTDNLVVGLAAIWRAVHGGHDVEEVHEAERFEPCSGIAATWCPNCGDCACPVDVDAAGVVDVDANPECPLHGLVSTHG